MKKNEGTIDRISRVVVGGVLIGTGLTGIIPGAAGIAAGAVGAVLVATGAVGFCPLYAALGMNTCPRN